MASRDAGFQARSRWRGCNSTFEISTTCSPTTLPLSILLPTQLHNFRYRSCRKSNQFVSLDESHPHAPLLALHPGKVDYVSGSCCASGSRNPSRLELELTLLHPRPTYPPPDRIGCTGELTWQTLNDPSGKAKPNRRQALDSFGLVASVQCGCDLSAQRQLARRRALHHASWSEFQPPAMQFPLLMSAC
jgi:hypothetical protein